MLVGVDVKHCFYLLLFVAALSFESAKAQTQYTGDGLPVSMEEEIRWRVNRGRFDSASENQLRTTTYTDVPASSGPLAPNQALRVAAQRHTTDMATLNVFQHETITGSAYYNSATQPQPWDRMTAEGYSWNRAAENIAAGYVGAEAVYVGWWKSDGHRVNMYNSGLQEIGIGYAVGSSGYRYWYTMDLGSSGNSCFFTDTLFRDANTNGVYDSGEGMSNVMVSLVVGTTVQSYYDVSSPVGSFAVPITSIAGGSTVQVVLSNANASAVILSIPQNFADYARVSLGPREKRVHGIFVRPTQVQNVGFRQLTCTPAPRLSTIVNQFGSSITCTSLAGSSYELQWSTNLVLWNSYTNIQAGTISTSYVLNASPGVGGKRFYRLQLR